MCMLRGQRRGERASGKSSWCYSFVLTVLSCEFGRLRVFLAGFMMDSEHHRLKQPAMPSCIRMCAFDVFAAVLVHKMTSI